MQAVLRLQAIWRVCSVAEKAPARRNRSAADTGIAVPAALPSGCGMVPPTARRKGQTQTEVR